MASDKGRSPNGPDPTLTALLPLGRDIEFQRAFGLAHPLLNTDRVLPFFVQNVGDGTPHSGIDLDAAVRPLSPRRVHVTAISALLDVTTSTQPQRHFLAQYHVDATGAVDAAVSTDAMHDLKAFQPHGVLSDSLPSSSRP